MDDDLRFLAAPWDLTSVCLYGAGKTGTRVFSVVAEAGGNVRFFLDEAAETIRNGLGIPVHLPTNPPEDATNFVVIIALFNREADTVTIARSLNRTGFTRIVSYLAFHERFHQFLGEHFWLGDPSLVDRESHQINAIDRLWADDESRQVFRSLVSLYSTRDPRVGPLPRPRDQEYLGPGIPGWPPAGLIRLIDCGAYDGDTVEHFLAHGLTVQAAACFEPDGANFRALRDRVRRWSTAHREQVFLWPCGVAERTGTFAFSSGEGESSHLTRDGAESAITCVALDDALPGFRPNLIKFDVEGAEEAALRGGREIIRTNRPGLAISVYHRPADLWRLPALVNEWDLGYRFFLRSYGFNGFDTVCYAVPAP